MMKLLTGPLYYEQDQSNILMANKFNLKVL